MKPILFILIFLFLYKASIAQDTNIQKDTDSLYKKIESFSQKRKSTAFLHEQFFRKVENIENPMVIDTITFNEISNKNEEGKIIRNIYFEIISPFGDWNNSNSTTSIKWIEKAGNNLHLKTQKWKINNTILLRKNTAFHYLVFQESERLLQSQSYISRAKIDIVEVENSSDSIDVFVKTLDLWSTIPNLNLSGLSKINVDVLERNFLGFGQEMYNSFTYYPSQKYNDYRFRYTIPNIRKSYVKFDVIHEVDHLHQFNNEIKLNRDFFSTLTTYAGGISYQNKYFTDVFYNNNAIPVQQNMGFNTFNSWLGYALKLPDFFSNNSSYSSLVSSCRLYTTNFWQKPDSLFLPQQYFDASTTLLGSIGWHQRRFIKTNYLYFKGSPEYIQTGKILSFTFGKEFRTSANNYIGSKITLAQYYKFGYLGLYAEFGTFFDKASLSQTAFVAKTLYFTKLFYYKNWKCRQFVYTNFAIGNYRYPIKYDYLNINNENGLNGFNSPTLMGTKKMVSQQRSAADHH